MRGMSRSGLAWEDGRGFVITRARFVHTDGCSSALYLRPLGAGGTQDRIEPNPSSGRNWADWVLTALGWLGPNGADPFWPGGMGLIM